MKVLLFNGSPHEHGCTYTALRECANELEAEGVDTEIVWIGTKAIHGCIACGSCRKNGQCAFDDGVNEIAARADEFDGFIFGSPVHYASACGALCSFMDRLFYSSSRKFRGKFGAAVVSCRRGGASAAFDRINKYFTISEMPIVSSRYWNSVHGNNPEEVKQDEEGLQTMRILGRNMAWLIKGKAAGEPMPPQEMPRMTNFIR